MGWSGTTPVLSWKDSVRVATAAALPAVTYANGTAGVGATLTADAVGVLTVDGFATVLGDRILVKNQVAGLQNGLYDVTVEGTAGVAAVLTRSLGSDEAAEVPSEAVFVQEGTANSDSGFTQTVDAPITMGTTALSYVQFTGLGMVTAGTGMTKTGNTLNVIGGTGITANADDIQIDSTVVTLSGTQTLTSKTLTDPLISVVIGSSGAAGPLTLRATSNATPGAVICEVEPGVEAWRTLATEELVVGVTTRFSDADIVNCRRDINSDVHIRCLNQTDGIAASAAVSARMSGGGTALLAIMRAYSPSFTTSGANKADSVQIDAIGTANGMIFRTNTASPFEWWPNDVHEMTLLPGGDLAHGTGEGGTVAATGNTFRAPDIVTGGAGNIAGAVATIAAGIGTGIGDAAVIDLHLPIVAATGDNIQTRASRLIFDMAASTTVLTMAAAQAMTISTAAGNLTLSPAAGGATVSNEVGADVDLRVEGDTLTHMLFLEGNAASENMSLLAAALPNWQSMDRGMFLGDVTTAPTGNPTAGIFVWSLSGVGQARAGSGTVTDWAPAGPHCAKCGYDAWAVACHNDIWKSWHYECGNCGEVYKGGPKSILDILGEKERGEIIRKDMGWDEVSKKFFGAAA